MPTKAASDAVLKNPEKLNEQLSLHKTRLANRRVFFCGKAIMRCRNDRWKGNLVEYLWY
jgi:hypothetical protein